MKKVIFCFLVFSLLITNVFSKQALKQFELEDSTRSAESVDSDKEYKKIKKLSKEAKLVRKKSKTLYKKGEVLFRSSPKNAKTGFLIAKTAIRWKNAGKRYYRKKGVSLRIYNDCSSFVRAVYYDVTGLDLFSEAYRMGTRSRSGCYLLYSYLRKSKQRISKRKPKVGDIVFFDNTYDKNRNRRNDDPFTHAGIVTRVLKNGKIEFVHANTGRPKRVRAAKLDLLRPSDKRENTYLKRRYRWDRSRRILAGQLLRGFGGFAFSGRYYPKERKSKDVVKKQSIVKEKKIQEEKKRIVKKEIPKNIGLETLSGVWVSSKIEKIKKTAYNPLGHWVLTLRLNENKSFRSIFYSKKSGNKIRSRGKWDYQGKKISFSKRRMGFFKRFSQLKLVSLTGDEMILKVKRKRREYLIFMNKEN